MSTTRAISGIQPPSEGDIFGHPRALAYLFATEMWERFSYYGMRALLVLYMLKYLFVAAARERGAGLASFKKRAGIRVRTAGDAAARLAHLRLLHRAGLFNADPGRIAWPTACSVSAALSLSAPTLMAIGHFMMAFEQLFLLALGFLILGNGAFKPNISTQVGALYAPGDRRRDRAFSIFLCRHQSRCISRAAHLRNAWRRTWAGTTDLRPPASA